MSFTGMPSVIHTTSLTPESSGLEDGVGGERRRHVDHADVRARFGHRLAHGVEHRHAEALLTATGPACTPADDLRAVLDALLGVERTLVAGNALANDLAVSC